MMSSRTVMRSHAAARPSRLARPAPAKILIRKSRTATVAVKAFFSFLQPKVAAPVVDPRRDLLAEELISVCEGTDGGSKASPDVKDQIEELVADLAPYSIKNPLRSPLIWGTYEVLYCSKPTAVGGPLKTGPGPVVFPGQRARQLLIEPNQLINEVTFSALGFLPGYSKQFGNIQPLSGDTFLLSIDRGELNTGVGGTQQKQFNIQRRIKIEFLDETLRIARFLPDEDLQDDENDSTGVSESEILFVFRRVEDDEELAEEEEEEEEAPKPAPKLSLPLFGGSGKVESLATLAERQVRAQQTRVGRAGTTKQQQQQQQARKEGTQKRGGTGFLFLGKPAQADEEEEEAAETPAQRRAREREEAAAARQRDAEERARAQASARDAARAAAEKAKVEAEREAARRRAEQEREEARRRAEQEKEEQRARAAAIREQLAELAEELKEAQAAAREVAKEVQDVKREYAPALKQVASAESAIAAAAKEATTAQAALQQAADERRAAEAALKEAQAVAKEAEAAFKKMQEALAMR